MEGKWYGHLGYLLQTNHENIPVWKIMSGYY
jgi:hypothetical protein